MLRSHFKLIFALSLIVVLYLSVSCQRNSLDVLERDVVKLKQEVGQSVVCLISENPTDGAVKFGSGIIIDENHILTTENFLENVGKMRIMLQDGRIIEDSQIVSRCCDFETNIALLEVELENLKPVKKIFRGEIKSGALGVALFNNQYSKGLCAVLGSVNPSWIGGDDIYDEELLIFNPLSSLLYCGTPVFNSKGELLGLVEGELEKQEGIVLLLSAETCEKVSHILIRDGKLERGWIGVVSDKTCRDYRVFKMMKQLLEGIPITQVVEGSPAWNCGLKPGDLIISYDEEEISCKTKFRRAVLSKSIGSILVLGIIRQGKEMSIKIEVKPRPEIPTKRRCPNRCI